MTKEELRQLLDYKPLPNHITGGNLTEKKDKIVYVLVSDKSNKIVDLPYELEATKVHELIDNAVKELI